jgi:hypothetical protein
MSRISLRLFDIYYPVLFFKFTQTYQKRCCGRVVKISHRRNEQAVVLKSVRPGFGIV